MASNLLNGDLRGVVVVVTDCVERKPILDCLEVEWVSKHAVSLEHKEDYLQRSLYGGMEKGLRTGVCITQVCLAKGGITL